MSLTVGQLAKLSGLSVRSLHHYDEIGLLCPSERSEAGYRLYSTSDVERLYKIQALRWIDLPLSEVKEILEGGGSDIPAVIDQKIAELTKQIDQATEMKSRLQSLRTRLQEGDLLGNDQLLGMVELFSRYEKHLSAQELDRFKAVSESEKDEWRTVYEDVLAAVQRNVAPDSDEGQALSYRWGVVVYKIANGDLSVAMKTKFAYETDESVRRSMLAATGTDPAVMKFVLDASNHAHLKLIAKYLNPEEMSRLNQEHIRRGEWLRPALALKDELAKPTIDNTAAQSLAAEWSTHFDACTGGDSKVKTKLLTAIRTDAYLKKYWQLNEELLDFIEGVRALER